MNHQNAQTVLSHTPKDEPVFVLYAQYVFATGLVAHWITLAKAADVCEAKL